MSPKHFTRSLLAGGLALALSLPLAPAQAAPQAKETSPVDGLTSATAAASCWEIKQKNPSASSGAYWLWTDQMDAPARFYCDQETDGGGWVLIGRGREGWSEDYAGKGDPQQLADNPDGSDAFSPVQLPSKTVDALLGGGKVQDLSDGVRFRRAGNLEGSTWQNMYAQRTKTDRWSWTLSAYHPWANIRYQNDQELGASRSYPDSEDRIANHNDFYYSNTFYGRSEQGWKLGFAYGSKIQGSSSPDSYLWSPKNQGNALAFTQVYLRPQVTQQDLKLADYPEAGTAAKTQRPLPVSYSSKVSWRTSPNSASGSTSELNTRVQAITQASDTVFIGGDFAYLEDARKGRKVNQQYLAGFDVTSGELKEGFRPSFNGQIKALVALPDQKLAVGGEFTQVNGQAVRGFVVLDAQSGQIDSSYDWQVANRNASGFTSVKSLQVQGGYLYLGGAFTHVKGATSGTWAYSKNVARFRLDNRSVDWSWRPITNGTVNGISASDQGVAIGGYFSNVNHQAARKLAYLSPADGSVAQNWQWKLSFRALAPRPNDGFQFDVENTGNSVWAAGTEHLLAQYQASNLNQRMTSAITKGGGDFQDLYRDQNQVLYAACHCGDWIYRGADSHDQPWKAPTYTGVDTIRLVTAYDAVTGQPLPDFAPHLQGARGHGVWASFVDSTGTLWVGGDITRSLGYQGVQRTVGFARYAARDSQAPDAPSQLTVSQQGSNHELTWKPSSERTVTYQILRNNRVVGSTQQTSFSLPAQDGARYFVRAADKAGNLSASTAQAQVISQPLEPSAPAEPADPSQPTNPAEPAEPAQPEPTTPAEPSQPPLPTERVLVPYGSNWQATFALGNEYDQTWKQPGAAYQQASSWRPLKAPLGWGEPSLATRVSFGYYWQPMSFFLRKDFEVPAGQQQDLVIKTYADDGLALYLNGREIGRNNLLAQAMPNTPASSARTYSLARATPLVITVPASQLQEGQNLLAVEVHSARRAEAASFDAELTLRSR